MAEENRRSFWGWMIPLLLAVACLAACSGTDTFDANTLDITQGAGGAATTTPTVTPGAPTITDITPFAASVGASITISGTNFDPTVGNNTITFMASSGNPQTATASSGTATELIVTIPNDAFGGDITVTNTGGVSGTFPYEIAPTITSVTPSTLQTSSGATIAVSGTGFDWITAGNNAITVQGLTATSINVYQFTGLDNALTFVLPASGLTAGNADVQITVNGSANQQVSTIEPLLTP